MGQDVQPCFKQWGTIQTCKQVSIMTVNQYTMLLTKSDFLKILT